MLLQNITIIMLFQLSFNKPLAVISQRNTFLIAMTRQVTTCTDGTGLTGTAIARQNASFASALTSPPSRAWPFNWNAFGAKTKSWNRRLPTCSFFFLCTENKFQVVRKCLNILLWFSVSSDNRQHIGQGSAVTAETFFYKAPLDCLMG